MDDLTIQRIKDAADIVDVVGSYVELHRKGQNWLGLCPFHNDEHLGSFVVSRNKKSYRCFSCGAHGDAIDFVMKMENVDFLQACKMLGQRYGIETDGRPTKSWAPKAVVRKPVVEKPYLELPLQYAIAKRNTEGDTLCNWLRSLPWDDEQRKRLPVILKDYAVGHAKQGHTIFWQFDYDGKLRTGKMMLYKKDGHRDHDTPGNFHWIHNLLQQAGRVNLEATPYKTCFFGLQMLGLAPHATINIVESEKTAIICATYWGLTEDSLWVACGGMTYLTKERLQPLIDEGRYIQLFPDHDGIERWTKIAKAIGYKRLSIRTDFVTKYWKPELGPKADIADILVRQMTTGDEEKPKTHKVTDALMERGQRWVEEFAKRNKDFARLRDELKLEFVKFL